MPLPLLKQAAICRALRCAYCHKKPSDTDVADMIKQFGDKLEPRDEGPDFGLRWICFTCCDRKPIIVEERSS